MEPMRRGASSAGILCTPQTALHGADCTDRWGSFMQLYEPFISRELTQKHPLFARALRQLERNTRVEQERQSAQVLATLRLKDSRILELQKVVDEQHEQLDVVLDELERRETKEDKEVQVDEERNKVDAVVQTECFEKQVKDVETQSDTIEEESGVVKLLEKLEKELTTLEGKNVTLERELQQRVVKKEKTESSKEMESCVKTLQRGVDAMNLSCSCVNNPLAFFVGVPEGEDSAAKLCVNLEHRLEAQAVRLEHTQECMYLWRDAVVQLMKRQSEPNPEPRLTIEPTILKTEAAGVTVNCTTALCGALAQIRQHLFQHRGSCSTDEQQIVNGLAKVLANGKSGVKLAAKMVQKWAGWEAKHLDEVRALRQGFKEERAEELSRRAVLLTRINRLEQQELDLMAELNALKKKNDLQDDAKEKTITVFSHRTKSGEFDEFLEYPQLAMRLATAEQSLLVKDEQLAAANETIRALSCAPASANTINMNQLAVELQRVPQQKLDFFRRREKDLVSVSRYFQTEKARLQLQSHLEVEQKHAAMMKAAKEVCEQECDELLMKVEKLETKALLQNLTSGTFKRDLESDNNTERSLGTSDALSFALKRLHLIENDRNALRERLRLSQQQLAVVKQQQPDCGQKNIVEKQTSALDCVLEHHQKSVDVFKQFFDRQNSAQISAAKLPKGGNDAELRSQIEWEVFVSHYEALWIAFNLLYSSVGESPVINSECSSVLRAFGRQTPQEHSNQRSLQFELSKRDEKILLLQQRLIDQGLNCSPLYDPVNLAELDKSDDTPLVEEDITKNERISEIGRPFLASKLQFESDGTSSNGPGNETTSPAALDGTQTMEGPKRSAATELGECLAKCAYLASQNTKLTRRLRAEKKTSEQYLNEQGELRKKLHARKEANSELQRELETYRDQSPAQSRAEEQLKAIDDINMEAENTMTQSEQEQEVLKEQLASREQENLTLVQSLCTIKEKCAQMEAIHQKELRLKATEHAESMESYIATVNDTLSRIENDKRRLEEDNSNLRSSLQKLQEKSAQQPQRSSKATSTDVEAELIDKTADSQENARLLARVQDLELQLSRERKLNEVVEQKKKFESLHEQQSIDEQTELLKAKQEYTQRSGDFKQWQDKIQQELADFHQVQRTAQQESDRRIEFLSACIEEFTRLADTGRGISTKELYDTVMALSKEKQSVSRGRKDAQVTTTNVLLDIGKQSEEAVSEAVWWKLRASKLEAYVRSAMLQNDTFEDTIRQLELGMSTVKEELASRLAREAQLLSTVSTLKLELATAKEHAASIAEKYHVASIELERRQGEATNRGDESQRARMAVQRKTELLNQQKGKVAALQQELEQAAKKLERLVSAEKQTASLQQKAKEHAQQLQNARQSYERCRGDNVQLSIHLEKMKERHAGVVARLKAARAENCHLREILKSNESDTKESARGGNQDERSAVSVAALTDEARALKRRVLQKQDVIISYKAKVAECEAQLERQRESLVKIARTNRELQQGQRQRLQQEQDNSVAVHTKLETQLELKQEQLDGLRASIYDSFEAFVFCQPQEQFPSFESPVSELSDDDEILKRWTDFSVQDLEELNVAQRRRERGDNHLKQKAATTALRDVEGALEANPEDCRAEICEFLQCLCLK